MNSKLAAVGRSPRDGVYQVVFYYQVPLGGRDLRFPEIVIPAETWEHMQAIVRAFNGA